MSTCSGCGEPINDTPNTYDGAIEGVIGTGPVPPWGEVDMSAYALKAELAALDSRIVGGAPALQANFGAVWSELTDVADRIATIEEQPEVNLDGYVTVDRLASELSPLVATNTDYVAIYEAAKQ